MVSRTRTLRLKTIQGLGILTVRCFLIGRGHAVPTPGCAPTPVGSAPGPAGLTAGCATPSSSSRFLPLTVAVAVQGGEFVGAAKRDVALVGVADWCPDTGGTTVIAGRRGLGGEVPGGCWAEGVVEFGGVGCGGEAAVGELDIAPGTTL